MGGCGTTILAEPLEAEVAETVLEHLDEPEVTAALARDTEQGDEAAIMAAIRADRARLEQFARDAADGTITRAEFLAARPVLVHRIEEGEAKLAAITRVLVAVAGGARDRWPGLLFEQKRGVLAYYLTAVRVSKGVRGYSHFDPKRIALTWAR